MHIIDSHFHWWPRSVSDRLCKRKSYPRAEVNGRGGYTYYRQDGGDYILNSWAEWFDLDKQLEHMDGLGHQVDVVCSIGPLSVYFSDLPAEEGRDVAIHWNEEMAGAQRKYPGRLWASAAVPLVDTKIAIEVLDDAVGRLGLMGVNMPGSIGSDPRIDAERLEPFYARVAELGLPMFLHPTDAVFVDMLDGYGGALHLSLGRVIEVSVAASRLVLSGIMERHPDPEDRDVAHRRRVALPVRPHGQEQQGCQAAAARQPLPQAHVYRHGLAARTGDEIRDRVLRHRPRDVRHRLSVLGSGDRARAPRRAQAVEGGPGEAFLQQCAAHSRPARSGANRA